MARFGGNPIAEATGFIENLAPGAFPVPIRTPLVHDECVWFLRAVADGVVCFTTCPPDCFRFKKWGAAGPDHFTTPHGKPRHLFSKPIGPEAWLNREYVPHIAAYAYAVLHGGHEQSRSSSRSTAPSPETSSRNAQAAPTKPTPSSTTRMGPSSCRSRPRQARCRPKRSQARSSGTVL